jgi:hypothetical protein
VNDLKDFGVIPVDISTLRVFFSTYQSPKDKIAMLEKDGEIIRLKNGLYVLSAKTAKQPLSQELIANHLYNPSYISFESALSHYGIIPERVYTTKSAVMKRSKKYTTPLGNFEYIQTDENYFSIGVRDEIVNNQYAYLIASPEKALCDLVVATKRIRLQSISALKTFLEEDMRCDLSQIKNIDIEIINQCAQVSPKKRNELNLLYKLLRDECF